jgi:alpha-L-fucosidase
MTDDHIESNGMNTHKSRSLQNRTLVIIAATLSAAPLDAAPLDSLQRAYAELRFGMFIHFGIETFNGGDYWDNATPPAQSVWNPTNLNCKNWADAAKAAQMKFGVLTTKHHYGFCLWNTSTTAYNCMNSGGPRIDVVKAYCDAFRADSLLPGFYYSMFDVFNNVDGDHGSFSRTLWNGKKAYIEQQLRELLTNYGPIPILVIDGWAWRMGHNSIPYQEIREFVKSLQPNCLMCDHDGVSKPWDNDVVMYEEPKGVYCPAGNTYASTQGQIIVSQSGGSWFWTGGGTIMTVANIRTHLSNLEPRYCNFLLNCPPTSAGVLDQRIIDTITKAGSGWTPDAGRPPLPAQPHAVEHPVTPVGAGATGGTAWNAIDGYNDVFGSTSVGQTLWSAGAPPQSITMDLGTKYYNLEILGYLPRQDFAGGKRTMTGNITSFTIAVSDDNDSFKQVISGTWVADSTYKIAEWSPAAAGRYVQLQAVSSNGNAGVVAGEIAIGGRVHTPSLTPVQAVAAPSMQAKSMADAGPGIEFQGSNIRLSCAGGFSENLPISVRLFAINGARAARAHGTLRRGELSMTLKFPQRLQLNRVYLCIVTAGAHSFTKRVIPRY